MTPFLLKTEYIELCQLLKAASVVSTGGQAKQIIVDGLVKVDGEVETRKGKKIRAGQKVEFDSHSIIVQNPSV